MIKYKEFRVITVEPDPFSRQWMALLTVRDWRTTLVAEISTPDGLLQYLKKPTNRIDMILLAIENPLILPRANWLMDSLAAISNCPPVLCVGLQGDSRVLQAMNRKPFVGYLLKEEIRHSMNWAAALAGEGNWVCTPHIYALGLECGFPFPANTLVACGQDWRHQFNDRELEVARLAFLFSLERKDLSDELDISEDYGYSVVSSIYKKLGLDTLFSGEEAPHQLLGNNPLLLAHFNRILEDMRGSAKAKDMETLAFHILSMPEVRKI